MITHDTLAHFSKPKPKKREPRCAFELQSALETYSFESSQDFNRGFSGKLNFSVWHDSLWTQNQSPHLFSSRFKLKKKQLSCTTWHSSCRREILPFCQKIQHLPTFGRSWCRFLIVLVTCPFKIILELQREKKDP